MIFPSPTKKFKPDSDRTESASVKTPTAPATQSEENKEENNDKDENKKDFSISTKYEINLHDTRYDIHFRLGVLLPVYGVIPLVEQNSQFSSELEKVLI